MSKTFASLLSRVLVAIVVAMLSFFAPRAALAATTYTDQATWEALAGTQSDDFEAYSSGTAVSDGSSFTGFTVTLVAGASMGVYEVDSDLSLCGSDDGISDTELEYTLDSPSAVFALIPQSLSYDGEICGYSGGSLVECVALTSGYNGAFFGVEFVGIVDTVTFDATVADSICSGELFTETDADLDGQTATAGDCDDADATAFTGSSEICDGVDNDCNGAVDDGTGVPSTWCDDADSDGYSDPSSCVTQCESPGSTWSASNPTTDCDDADAAVNPAQSEVPYNGIDDDCDSATADDDLDGDGWESSYDCNDEDATVSPDATEVADGIDNDCDGTADEGTSAYDDDGDGQSEDGGDCNDSDPSVYTGATEICNTVDDDCDGLDDVDDGFDVNDNDIADCLEEDLDGDEFVVDDCQPLDGSSYPGAAETCDGVDNDCDDMADEGTECYDDDGDGWTEDSGDCDDAEALNNPSQAEVWYDGIDSDCAGDSDYDQDGDTYDSSEYGGADCDDLDAAVNPDAAEVLNDGVDNDCDESTSDVEEPDDTGDDTGDYVEPDDSAEEAREGKFYGGGGCLCSNGSPTSFGWWGLLLLIGGVRRRK